jgi:hypothetical protein
MTDVALTGHPVVKLANDSSLGNSEPALITGSVVGIVGAVASVLVIGGYIDPNQSQQLKDAAGQLVPAVLIIAAIIQAIITRLHVYSPKSAAQVAVMNAAAPAGTPPSLDPPP